MRYEIIHRTIYKYQEPISVGHHLARLAPKNDGRQTLLWHGLDIDPAPSTMAGHTDYFGNRVLFFALHGSHKELVVTAHSRVIVNDPVIPDPLMTPPWETLRDGVRADELTPDAEAGEFSFPSPFIKPDPVFAKYALTSFIPGRAVLAAAIELNSRMFRDFKFDPKATDVATPILEAFKLRRGVCQDFAQIYIACLRSIGLPVRYVSGYLETLPPPGKPKMVGADASHAWVSVWCGAQNGWVDLDPTNNCLPSSRHISVAIGRDFGDVSPLRGVVYGSGDQELKVQVDVRPMSELKLVEATQSQSQSPSQQ
jgi:transglutaminase-like putative cysteine protease